MGLIGGHAYSMNGAFKVSNVYYSQLEQKIKYRQRGNDRTDFFVKTIKVKKKLPHF